MKKLKFQSIIMALCLVITAGFWSCNDEDVDNDGPMLEVLPSTLSFGDQVSTQTLTVKANREWTATFVESGIDWVSITPDKGSGEGTINVTVLANPGAERVANLKITSSINSATVRISQVAAGGSVIEGDALYQENCGSDVYEINASGEKDDNGKWPFIDQYTQYFNPNWEKGGTLDQAGVTYSGSSASVRNSGANYAPADGKGFSGAPYVFMSSGSAEFLIKEINLGGKTNFTFTFSVLYQADYDETTRKPVFGKVTSSVFTFYASIDGTNWSKVDFTSDNVEGWSKVTAMFKVPDGTSKLYVKFANSNNQVRYDDFKLYEGGNGELLGQGGGEDPQPIDAIFYEAFGSVKAEKTYGPNNSFYPYVDQYIEFLTKGGKGATNVTYEGRNTSVRPTMSSEGYEGASGVNSVFFGTAPSYVQINDIDLGTAKKLTLSFGVSKANNGEGGFVAVVTEDVKVEVSKDGSIWKSIPYTISGEGWVLVTSEFAVPSDITKLSLKFTVPTAETVIRIDDIKLVDGGNGEEIDFTGETPVEQLKTISEVQAHWKGGNTEPESGWKIKGVVVSDKDGKNLQSYQFALQEGTEINSGVVISYVRDEPTPVFEIGDTVAVDLTGASYNDYGGLLQINMTAAKVTKVNSGPVPQPLNITVAQLKTGNYASMLVSIDNVELVDKNVPTMNSNNGNVAVKSGVDQFVMRTAGSAVFKNESTPKGVGTLIGLAGVYNGVYQVSPRNKVDYAGMKSSVIFFGTPTFTGTLKVNSAATNAKIVIPYFDAQGTEGNYNVSVSMIGAIDGLTVAPVNYTVSQAGNGTIEVPVTGTPITEGDVTFAITGIDGLTTNTVGTKINPNIAGGTADFNTIAANSSYGTYTSTAGWVATNAAVYKGGESNNAPIFAFISSSADDRAICLNGKKTTIGVLTSPVLTGGCGTLSFKYGNAYGEANGFSVKIEIFQNEVAVKTFNLTKPNAEVVKQTAYDYSVDVNVSGDFKIVITNNHPSNSTSNKDRAVIWNMAWTDYAGN